MILHCSRAFLLAAVCIVVIGGCSSKATFKLSQVESDPAYGQTPAQRIAVLAFYPDAEFEIRAMVENAFTGRLREEGIDAEPGYRFFDEYDNLEQNVSAASSRLLAAGVDTVLFIDPVRAVAYDPGEYASRRATYRALGMDTSAWFAAVGQVAAESDASKYIMEVTVWCPRRNVFGWAGRYDIKAQHGYDPEYAKAHSADFAREVAKDLRAAGML